MDRVLRQFPVLLRWVLIAAIGLLIGGCKSQAVIRSTQHFPQGTGFVRYHFDFEGKQTPLWVFIPKNYDPQQKWPAIVFLHGLFEAGKDGDSCLSAGLGPVIAKSPDTWPFITIFPQSDGTWRGEKRRRLVLAAMDFTQANWSIDQDRVILAGLSYGAVGVWQIGAMHPDRFAALVPVASRRLTEPLERLILMPVWAFAFRDDPISSPQSSEQLCQLVSRQGGQVRLTLFNGFGHDCWDRAVSESELIDWMLRQRRSASANRSNATVLTRLE